MPRIKLTRKDPDWWRRQHAKGIEKMTRIECVYWRCPWRTISFTPENGLRHNMNWCTCPDPITGRRVMRNMNYWFGMQAPNWCPRRKQNGGKE